MFSFSDYCILLTTIDNYSWSMTLKSAFWKTHKFISKELQKNETMYICMNAWKLCLNAISYFPVYGFQMPIYGSYLSQYGKIRDRIQAFFCAVLLYSKPKQDDMIMRWTLHVFYKELCGGVEVPFLLKSLSLTVS